MSMRALRGASGWAVAVVMGGAVVAGAAPALVRSAAPDWPQWRGPCRDGVSAEQGLLQAWPEGGPKLLWKAGGLGRGYSSPIAAAGGIYITGDFDGELRISALTLDGQPRWCATNGAPWKASFPGARSSCAYDDGKVFHLNAHGRLCCLDAATGAEVWSASLLERYGARNIMWGICESVLVWGGRVYATPAGTNALMVALDARTGREVWATPALEGEQASYSSPVLVDTGARKLLVNCGSKRAFAVDAQTGALVWQCAHLDPKNTVNVTPVLAGRMLVLNNSSRDAGFVFGVPLDGAPGERAWTQELKVSHGGLVAAGGRVFGASLKGESAGWVALDAESGRSARMAPAAELADGSALYADGRLYVLTAKGLVTLQEVTDAGFRRAGAFTLGSGSEKDAWAHPVLSQGRLYLRLHDALFCYDVRR